MPTLRIPPDLDMHYVVDDFTDPWTQPETMLLLHGNSESGLAWNGWMPQLARRFRVVRPDMRGYGQSTPMPRDYPWSVDSIISDYLKLMDTLDIPRFHLVGAKIGGTIARAFAARHPQRVRTLTVIGTPAPSRPSRDPLKPLLEDFEKNGVEPWARRTMAARLGSKFPAEGVEWWIKLMGRTAVSSQIGFMPAIAWADIRADLPKIKSPTLVITTEENGHNSIEATREWQQAIPNSTLRVLPGDSYHVAASDPELCARETLEFISRQSTA
jgi:pimeloyl-ACP methyl ester carboxylesterase